MKSIAALRFALLPALAIATVTSSPAGAQIMPGPGLGKAPKASQAPAAPPPPAWPGAGVDKEMVAPPERLTSDMQPNAALFGSINRGDIAAARDALSRGADLNARNILGMTPLDLAIDLGRKNIAFLLLSMRGSPASASNPPPEAKVAETKPAKASKSQKAERRPAKSAPTAAAAAPQTPRLFAGDGGTPVPSAGFLGFDASDRTAR